MASQAWNILSPDISNKNMQRNKERLTHTKENIKTTWEWECESAGPQNSLVPLSQQPTYKNSCLHWDAKMGSEMRVPHFLQWMGT